MGAGKKATEWTAAAHAVRAFCARPAGPLLERATCVVFEGVPTYPTPSRCWEVVDKLKVRPRLAPCPRSLACHRHLLTRRPHLRAWVAARAYAASMRSTGTFLPPAACLPACLPQVKQFYTAPTLIRSLMRFGDEPVKAYERSSLRILGSVGEPINPEA